MTQRDSTAAPPVAPFSVEVFFDGDCPLCRKEIGMIRRFDRRGQIRFTDIADDDFSPIEYGVTMQQLMEQIHGRDAEGNWLIGVEVFRQLYAAIGFGPIVAVSRLPVIRHGLEAAYRLFASQRLRLTGRCVGQSCEAP